MSGYKHGLSRSRLDNTLDNMIKRCESPADKRWNHYGGKGIKICPEWRKNRAEFYRWALANGYRQGLQIDRIDVNGDYCPENCRWVDAYVQMNNTTRNHFISFGGKTLTIAQWARELGVLPRAIEHRVARGWDIERVISQPFRKSPTTRRRIA